MDYFSGSTRVKGPASLGVLRFLMFVCRGMFDVCLFVCTVDV